jgi:hypothetical protein
MSLRPFVRRSNGWIQNEVVVPEFYADHALAGEAINSLVRKDNSLYKESNSGGPANSSDTGCNDP